MKKRSRIVFIIDVVAGELGGTESQLLKLINGISKEKYDIYLICFDNSKWLRSNRNMFKCNVEVININNFYRRITYVNIIRLIRYLKSLRPDIVHTYFPIGNILGVLAARIAGIRNVISSRRDYGEWINRRYLIATRIANRFAKRILANSKRVRDFTVEKEKIRNGRIDVIYNGVELERFRSDKSASSTKRDLNIPNGDSVVGILANFRPMKHHYTFLEAAAEILKVREDVSFILIGIGPLKEETEALGRFLGIQEKLTFVGLQKDVSRYLSIMDVGVNCSEREGLSNAIIEHMAAGVPCIVSNAGGNPELITHGVNGYLFELDDYKELASLILSLIEDEELREKFAKNARELVEREMSLEMMLSRYESFYDGIRRA